MDFLLSMWIPVVGAVILGVWLFSKRITKLWLRILLRAFTIAFFFTPFIPHRSVEWSSPWPPAIVWVIIGLTNGMLASVEMLSIFVTTLVLWVDALAICLIIPWLMKNEKSSDAGRSGTAVAATVLATLGLVVAISFPVLAEPLSTSFEAKYAMMARVLFAHRMLLWGSVLVGFVVALATAYQLYLEKKQPAKFQSQKWLREGLPTKMLGTGRFQQLSRPRRAGLILGIASAAVGAFLFLVHFGNKESSLVSFAGFIFPLLLLSQAIFLIWAGRHFGLICDAIQPPRAESAVPPPQPPPVPNA